MKVALVHDWLTGMRGGEKCLEVFCQLYPDADLYTLVYEPDRVSLAIRRMNVKASWIDRLPGARKHFRYLLPFFPQAIESFELSDYDLILSSSHCVAKGIYPHRALHIAYVFTPMRYLWDMGDAYRSGGMSLMARAGLTLSRAYLRHWDLTSAGRVDQFIAISNNIAAKIERIYGRTAKVIHPPVRLDNFQLSDQLQPYYLIVSALVPYKRVDLAVDAFNALKLPLKIAGDGPLRRFLQRRAQSNIEFLGWVDDRQLTELYAQCQAVIFPGEEDFGIVPLEAQASGRPVIAYGKGGVTESVIDIDDRCPSGASPTGLFFFTPTPAGLIEAVQRYQEIKHVFRPAALRRHAEHFSPDVFKAQIGKFIDRQWLERSSSLRQNAQAV